MLTRRRFISATALGAGFCLTGLNPVRSLAAAPAAEGQPFGFEALVERARHLAESPFDPQPGLLPASWKDLSYDEHRQIRFRPDQALWRGERLFEAQFFHPGLFFDRKVPIHVVENGVAREVAFDTAMFDYGQVDLSRFDTQSLGFAGFRLHYPLHSTRYADEFLVFLGASYFRVVGRNQHYGLSARGLAIDTALEKGEEFPIFREFWLEKPAAEDTSLTLYALLDSPSVSGAYRFVVRPRTQTQIEVKAVVFPRRKVQKIGLAPLTSMFFYGENRHQSFDDFRPEVHDSDGLMIQTGAGEWLWRPLANRKRLNISAFVDDNPRGFGLVQRDRDFAHYQDLESQYERRPSIWITPLGNWGPGHVELVEIPTDTETNDNIVTYWVPKRPVVAGEPLEFSYLLSAYLDQSGQPPGGQVVSTRIGTATRPGAASAAPEDARLFVVDFAGGDLPFLGEDQPVEAVVSSSAGKMGPVVVQRNPHTQGWRAFFDFYPDGNASADLRGFLRLRDHVLTETWSYLWTAG